jgi:hypothetical protein
VAWAGYLDELSVPHSPIIEASIGWLLVFNDPDGLELHLHKLGRAGHRPLMRFRSRRGGHDQALGQAAAVGPGDERLQVALPGWVGRQPVLEAGLGERGQRELVVVEPGQQQERRADVGPQAGRAVLGGRPPPGRVAGAADQVPLGVGLDDGDVSGRGADEQVVGEPGDAFEVFVADRQNPGGDQYVAGVVQRLRWRQVVENGVTDRLTGGGKLDEQPRGCLWRSQMRMVAGFPTAASDSMSGWSGDGTVSAGPLSRSVRRIVRTPGAAVVAVEHGGSAAAGAGVGDVSAGARPDSGSALVGGDERLERAALGAGARV